MRCVSGGGSIGKRLGKLEAYSNRGDSALLQGTINGECFLFVPRRV